MGDITITLPAEVWWCALGVVLGVASTIVGFAGLVQPKTKGN